MIQFRDDTFSDAMPVDEAFDKFKEFATVGEAKALHVGTRAELLKVKEEADQQTQINDLKDRLASIENMEPIRSDVLHIPSNEDVLRFGPKEINNEV